MLVAGSIGDASNLLPALASDASSFDIIGLVYNGLVRYDKDLKIEGELASLLGDLPRRPADRLSPAPRREVARRRGFHGRRRRVHLARHDRPEDADRLRGGLPAGQALRGRRPADVPRDLRQAVRAGPDLLGVLGDAEAPARGQGHHRLAARPGPRRHRARTASRSGKPARRSSSRPTTATGRGGRTSTGISTGSSPTARRCSSSFRPAISTRWGSIRCSTRARPTPNSSRKTTASTAISPTATATSAST